MDKQKNAILSNARKSRYVFEYRITILGDKMTGKSSLLNRYINNTFTHRYRPTIQEHVTHIVEHKGSICVCLFIDTCGGNDFPAMRRLEIAKGNAFFVVYAINDRKTFDTCKSILAEIKDAKSGVEDLKIILVGTKIDLEDSREVRYEEGTSLLCDLTERHINAQFFEVTATNESSVDFVFTTLLNMYIKDKPVIEGRNSSIRRSIGRRKKGEKKQKKQVPLQESCFSDSDIDISPSEAMSRELMDRDFRCHSASPQLSKTNPTVKDANPKHFIQRTFGSMQRILKSGSTNPTEGLVRSNTYDNSYSKRYNKGSVSW